MTTKKEKAIGLLIAAIYVVVVTLIIISMNHR